MLMMRLQRVGRKNEPSYRVVVVDKRASTKANKNIDQLGFYNPKLGVIEIDGEKAKHWLSHGVQASDTVHNMLVTKKIIDAKKINVLPKMKNRKVVETPTPVAEETAPVAEVAA
jgi:small subunit ribosomal protein S16